MEVLEYYPESTRVLPRKYSSTFGEVLGRDRGPWFFALGCSVFFRIPRVYCPTLEIAMRTHAGRDIRQIAVGGIDTIDALVRCGGTERTEAGDIRTQLEIVKRSGQHIGSGLPGAARIPSGSDASAIVGTHIAAEGQYGLRVVVSTLDTHACQGVAIAVDEGGDTFGGQFLADVLAEKGAVAPLAAVGAKGEVDGKGHFVRVFLEDDVVVVVFKHRIGFDD